MGIYNVHAGHCPYKKGAYGAVGILNESNEARAVKNEVIILLKENGHTVYDCTCEENTTQNGCLQKIVAKCNEHDVDLDISIHLNSGRNDYKGDDSTGGVEVYCYDSKTYEVAKKIAENIGKEFGYRLRSDGTTSYAGVKKDSSLYVLKNTKANAILIECCFVDDADDAKVWDAKKCAKAIVDAILNKEVSSETVETPTSQPTNPSIEDIAKRVINGEFGNGAERQSKVESLGYNYSEVQNKVNELLGVKPSTSNKPNQLSIEEVAKKVIAGEYGNGDARKSNIEKAGYNYAQVQTKVNELLGVKTSTSNKKSITQIAQEVIAGKWGNGTDRKNRLEKAGYNYSQVQAEVNRLL